eukprot:TRINITY_DN21638_c0_g1_i4.p1 TRINITY_DN21638_c0_g1~~TRINITY_DN21638_c0_g1_i4.p1  ORF type:complete len:154 (-),score=22.78 TRINITY_DN21638_c0_g1_i4:200-661(-)
MCIRDSSKSPSQQGVPPLNLQMRPWSNSLVGCCNQGCWWCCQNIGCCGCCNLGRAVSIATDVHYLLGCACGCCCLPCSRCKLVETYKLDESKFMSCVIATFCTVCAAAQMVHEVEAQTLQTAGMCGNWNPSVHQNPQQPASKAPGQIDNEERL